MSSVKTRSREEIKTYLSIDRVSERLAHIYLAVEFEQKSLRKTHFGSGQHPLGILVAQSFNVIDVGAQQTLPRVRNPATNSPSASILSSVVGFKRTGRWSPGWECGSRCGRLWDICRSTRGHHRPCRQRTNRRWGRRRPWSTCLCLP
jgi:hypothetical protein